MYAYKIFLKEDDSIYAITHSKTIMEKFINSRENIFYVKGRFVYTGDYKHDPLRLKRRVIRRKSSGDIERIYPYLTQTEVSRLVSRLKENDMNDEYQLLKEIGKGIII